MRSLLLGASASVALAAPAHAQEQQQVQFNVPAQDTASALNEFSRQAGVQILFPYDVAARTNAPTVEGSFTRQEALNRLLQGSTLRLASDDGRTIVLQDPNSPTRLGAADRAAPSRADEEIVVTGSRIRGAQTSSPVLAIGRREMELSGHTNLGEALRAQPQNFSGGQNPEVGIGIATAGGAANQNASGGSGLNLRGLGPGATVTLLNGNRLPYDGVFNATDISVIPVAAIERVEVLLDGASAVYGADAIGGVANIILRRDYDGAELSARYGVATDGGYEQQQYTALVGRTWGSGGFIITADYADNTRIEARDRGYLSYMINQDVWIYPENTQQGVLLSGHQRLGRAIELSLDAVYSDRVQTTLRQAGTLVDDRRDAVTWGVAPAIAIDLPATWSLRLAGFIGENEVEWRTEQFNITTGAALSLQSGCLCNTAESLGIEAEGPLFTLPGGPARLALGAGYRSNSLSYFGINNGAPLTLVDGRTRDNRHVFAEVQLPLIGEAQAIPLVSRLTLNGAVRYENYNDFGDVTAPKVGLLWGVTPDLDIRASWGASFKTPTFPEQYLTRSITHYPASFFSVAGAPASARVLYLSGANPDLDPEQAEVTTLGVIARPGFAPGLRIELGWFNIDYEDRITTPLSGSITSAINNPIFAEFVTLNPSVAQQNAAFAAVGWPVGSFASNPAGGAYDPASVIAIVDGRNTNVSWQRASGFDLTVSYITEALGGTLSLGGNASWLDGERRFTPLSATQPTTGVIFFPPEFRTRLSASWSRGDFTLASAVNYIDGVVNTNLANRPKGDAITTVDLVLDYRLQAGSFGPVEFNLGVTNLFDEAPPYLEPQANFVASYDPTNYSAIGRVINFRITKPF